MSYRQLFIAGRVKATNENIVYTVDLLYAAIIAQKQIKFRYYEYNKDKKQVFSTMVRNTSSVIMTLPGVTTPIMSSDGQKATAR